MMNHIHSCHMYFCLTSANIKWLLLRLLVSTLLLLLYDGWMDVCEQLYGWMNEWNWFELYHRSISNAFVFFSASPSILTTECDIELNWFGRITTTTQVLTYKQWWINTPWKHTHTIHAYVCMYIYANKKKTYCVKHCNVILWYQFYL